MRMPTETSSWAPSAVRESVTERTAISGILPLASSALPPCECAVRQASAYEPSRGGERTRVQATRARVGSERERREARERVRARG